MDRLAMQVELFFGRTLCGTLSGARGPNERHEQIQGAAATYQRRQSHPRRHEVQHVQDRGSEYGPRRAHPRVREVSDVAQRWPCIPELIGRRVELFGQGARHAAPALAAEASVLLISVSDSPT